jgi:phospholipid-binding lipoprotein MlaA
MTNFNDVIITYALNPVSKAYAAVIPNPIRVSISNFITNINFPIRFANNILQGKWQNSKDELERFLTNSTVGLGGLFDVASNELHIPLHKEDFGQTLGHYGVGPGYHVVLPFFGPSNVRDSISLFTADAYLSPLVHFKGLSNYRIPNNLLQSAGIVTFHFVNKDSLEIGKYESLKKDAIDLYPFLRDIYESKRESDIKE